MSDVRTLANAITVAAHLLDIPVEERPDLLARRRLMAETLAQAFDGDASPADAAVPLPEDGIALVIGYHPVLIGSLGDDPERTAVMDLLRRWHNQAVVARSWLGWQGEDLQVFLAGPPGSKDCEAWRAVAMEIERNERVCRKLVWLPPATSTQWPHSLDAFVQRSFLARPWKGLQPPEQEALDRMAHLFRGLAQQGLAEPTAKRWLNLLTQDDIDREDLAEELVAALRADA